MIKAVIFDLNGIFLQWKGNWLGRQDVSEQMFVIAKNLRAQNIKVFVLSNNVGEALFHRGRYNLIKGAFDKVYYAWQTGHVKPNPKAWQHVLEEDNLKPEECLYFDDQESNVRAAESLGIKSFLFTNESETEKIIEEHINENFH